LYEEIFLQSAELLIDEVVGLVDKAEGDVGDNLGRAGLHKLANPPARHYVPSTQANTQKEPHFLRRKLQLRDLLFLALGVILLAGASFYAWSMFGRYRENARLVAALPRLYSEICSQRECLTRAIDAYKQSLSFYPPDHVLQQNPLTVDPLTNQLLYELVGSVREPDGRFFEPMGYPPVSAQMLKTYFHSDHFANSVEQLEQVRHFLDSSNIIATMAIHQKPDVALLAYFPSWEGIEPELMSQIELGSWRYNQSSPVHNPGKYDLWIEIRTGLTNIVIGNW